MSKLRIGIIGGGLDSAVGRAHISALRMDGKYELAPSIFSRDDKINYDSHKAYNMAWEGTQKNLVTYLDQYGKDLDLVLVATPSVNHSIHYPTPLVEFLFYLPLLNKYSLTE